MTALHTSTTTILNIHDELLCQLQPSTESTSSSTPPDPFGGYTGTLALINQYSTAFLATIEYMKVYSCYCASYLSAKEELALLQRSYPILNEFTVELYDRARADHGVDVISNMIKPVQRICRYPLLFRELLKNATTPEETLILQQSLQKIQAVSTYVNEKVQEAQNNARLYELHRSMHPSNKLELLHPSRTLLCETTAGVLNLDPPGWPAKLLWHFRRRRRRESSYKDEPDDTQHRYSSYADDRRGSATVSTSVQTVMSPTTCSSPPSKSTSSASFLLRGRRRSSTGEKMRLILLSDMLLMAKRREEQLKIRRQICLSCAVVHDWDDENEAHEDHEEDNRDPAALLYKSCAFTLEVAKIGRCNCQSLSQVTIRRSPRGPLSGLLATRRGSLSFSASAGEVLQYLQQEQERNTLARTTKASRGSRSGSRLRGHLESIAGIRAVKRYMVMCETPQRRQEFVTALRQAISRSARMVSIHNAAAEQARSPSLVTGSAMAMAIAVKLPTKIWNSLRHGEITPGAAAGLTACSTGLRRRGSLAITMMPTSTNNSSSVSQLATTEADLLGLEDTPQVRTAEVDEKTDTTLV
ncbi:hypothetical protein Poli38472_009910 [Pythium oligandrum]|uniref:DH domain-containing protein n=1 Tax=Pythium oligandrum TaxID=41045 RepID=A0A8K1FDH0_PYTOL|nr:hypothetical protein Poli38472_009910 [Pythium oligandrum]|eukprot:TMW58351.1 hypothetical protein Poli38472_009910 [Pythium oligandrum]